MSSEPKLIAIHGMWRVLEDGSVEHADDNGMGGEWVERPQTLEIPPWPALLAGAVRRLTEYVDNNIGAVEQCVQHDPRFNALQTTVRRWCVEFEGKVGKLTGRMDDLDQLGGDYTSLDGRISTLADRLAALESKQGDAERLWNSLDVLGGRVATLEDSQSQDHVAGHELEIRVAALERATAENYSTCSMADKNLHQRIDAVRDMLLEHGYQRLQRIESLEYRQQGEAEEGEGAETPGDVSLGFDVGRKVGRRERAREIVKGFKERYGSGVPVSYFGILAWMESKYLGGE